MLEAMLHGKLSREQKNMEDILTSCIFGLLKYVPPDKGLMPFLALARTPPPENSHPLGDLANLREGVELTFWPMWSTRLEKRRCEPDVIVRIDAPQGRVIALIEAKYRSGKSGEADEREDAPPNDQLAREWGHLLRQEEDASSRLIVYLTADVCMPCDEIADSMREYHGKQDHMGGPEPAIAWLSWRHLMTVAEGSEHPVMRDLTKLLARLGLLFYRGIREVRPLPSGAWSFGAPIGPFRWGVGLQGDPLSWRFRK